LYARECVRCHGQRGVGGPNVHIGNPQLLQTASNGFIRYAIKNGRPGTLMPSFSKTIGDEGIEDLTALLRSWVDPAPPPPAPAPPPPIPLGPVPLNPRGPDPVGFKVTPETTPMEVIHAQLQRGARMVLLDARAPSDYMNQHIAGAVSVPFYDPSPYLEKLPKSSWLVCYCACPHAESGSLAAKLLEAGFKKVTVLDEGLGAWVGKKYSVSSGEKP
jgi:cytochrome c oxidase cbb3-type subunit 3/ubiquinol-cytochrome c reductase cytochrome c subunit